MLLDGGERPAGVQASQNEIGVADVAVGSEKYIGHESLSQARRLGTRRHSGISRTSAGQCVSWRQFL